MDILPQKRCSACKQFKLLTDFNKNRRNPDGYHNVCLPCRRDYDKGWRQRRIRVAANNEGDKVCSTCGITKPVTEFVKNAIAPDGRGYRCSECHREASKDWAARNRKRLVTNADLWRKLNRERHLASRRNRRQNNLERERARFRVWYWQNLESQRRRASEWAKKNPDKVRVVNQRRRVKKLGNGGDHTYAEWKALCEFYENKCLRCGKQSPEIKLTEDHITPVSAGGSNDISNIQPLCLSCNISKHVKHTDYRLRFMVDKPRYRQLSLF